MFTVILSLMKAARIHQHGAPDVLVYEDIPDPKIKANQILVRVRACALNHLDLFIRAGIPGMKFAMPHILGSDIAGEVVEVGELCERVKPGWRVLLSPGLSCRQCDQCARCSMAHIPRPERQRYRRRIFHGHSMERARR